MALELSRSLRLFLLIATAIPLYSAASSPPLTTLRQQQPPGVSIKLWCVAKNNADDSALQSAIDWACGTGGADCTLIQQGGPCYDPADIRRTASYAFNDYCTKNGMSEDTCNFANTAALTSLDPSHTHCKFPSSLEGKSGEGKGTGTGGGGSTADLTSRGGINIACDCGMWCRAILVIIHFFWLTVV
ncbi:PLASMODESMATA CALLOSE-BINDING PROTEIN 5-like [Cynara cardunculus var. scolymus]|uniref:PLASMODESMATA CALLOSE-BINDING PROTEIN 5-like n=1 Tax=Cynara cardunculus var. scolymus TaxID=59895 RepID=UPI000D630410|nr:PLASMODESMATA CALLOSE-BINDING PROTEIN 5-like [Cynara cardunculus var. scolymus]